ncbi:glycoside hydrolase family 5 protein [Cerasicoccus maritimus]|uniref:glycoside hydrolase family 5 protein n=1 Tax=Cerasicoccus maritimus TaxID=490089 RepID=UPI0028527735|nr:glycoside hydrolase family 5 protein [Cerasicoccus maritimus]
MKKNLSHSLRFILALCALCAAQVFAQAPVAAPQPLVGNSSFEIDADGDNWPDGWAQPKIGGSWQEEAGSRFIRMESPAPGEMVMLYQEIEIPEGVEAIEMTWKQRISNLKRGEKSWFDARIMMEFMDANRSKVPGKPRAPATNKNTDGWVEKKTTFLVPEGAKILKFMPCLFNVASGTYDIDDLVLMPTDPTPLRAAAEQARIERDEKKAKEMAKTSAKAEKLLADTGSYIVGGDFEGRFAKKKNVVEEGGNHYLRLVSTEPGEMVMDYREVNIPSGIEALELSWTQRVTGLKKGEKPWFDARIMMEWKDATGKKLKSKPSPSYTQRDTKGWVDKTKAFLVPEDAATLIIMTTLFNVKAGTYEVDNFVLKPTDPGPIKERAAARARQKAAKFVPAEEPKPENWPKMLKVVGNRLHDTDGNEVWLQGVNAGGLETLPMDEQPVKSLVVGIDEWNSNCIRVPIKESFWWGESPYQKDGGKGYREIIDKMITLAANRGAYIVIDLHRYRAPKEVHAKFWREFAALYKDHPAVLFDIMNEPHGISWEIWRNGGWVGNKSGTDESAFLTAEEKKKNQGFESIGMQGLVDAVRSTGAKNIIIAGGVEWCNDLSGVVNGYALDDPSGNGIMYSWHTYHWHKGWATKLMPAAEKYPIFLGEVGADVKKMGFIPDEIQEDPATFVPDMLGFIQKYKINWTGWCFHPYATPRMLVDWDYTPTPFWGVPAKEALAGKQFELKKLR